MPFTPDDQNDLFILQGLSTHITGILDIESAILDADRQLTDANITKLNDTYASVLDVIKQIVDGQLLGP